MAEKIGLEEFRKTMYEAVKEIHITRFPYNDFLFNYYDQAGGVEE